MKQSVIYQSGLNRNFTEQQWRQNIERLTARNKIAVRHIYGTDLFNWYDSYFFFFIFQIWLIRLINPVDKYSSVFFYFFFKEDIYLRISDSNLSYIKYFCKCFQPVVCKSRLWYNILSWVHQDWLNSNQQTMY